MMDLKKMANVIAIGLLPYLSIGCGGSSSSSEEATVTFTVEDITGVSQKKLLESGDNISEVKVLDLDGKEIGTLTHLELRTYIVTLEKGIDFIIRAIIKNGNNGEFELESIIEDAQTQAVRVDQDSTEIATIIRERANQHNQNIKDFIKENEDETDDVVSDIASVETKEFINNALENLGKAESLADVAKQLALIIKELERITHIIDQIKDNLKEFNEGSEENFRHTDFNDDERKLSTEELANHLGGAQDGETGEEEEFEIEIGENGEVVVTRDNDSANIETDLASSSIVKGKILGVNDDVIELGVRSAEGRVESRFVNPGTNTLISEILASLHEGEEITVKFEVDGDTKYIINIFGRGVTTGEVIEKGESYIIIEDAAGNHTKFTPRWVNTNDETETTSDEANSEASSSSNDEVTNKSKGQLDPETIELIGKITVGDKVAIIWEIDERKRIINISWINKFNLSDEPTDEAGDSDSSEEPADESDSETNEGTATSSQGKVKEKGEDFFIFSGNRQEANAEPEVTKIFINKEIAYHKEILASLIASDEVSVTFITHNEINTLVSIKGEGLFTGTLIEKTDSSIYVKDSEGRTVKFTPNWVKTEATPAIGGLDPEMLKVFSNLELQSSISVEWKLDERKRAIKITGQPSTTVE